MSHESDFFRRIEDVVDRAATSVQSIHQSIADLPFEVLERNGLWVETSSELRDVQVRTLGAIYDVVRSVNHRVGDIASDLLDDRSTPTSEDDGSSA